MNNYLENYTNAKNQMTKTELIQMHYEFDRVVDQWIS